jgi:NTP pyrophosphatase (non-canonical NTP hydrolase)
MNSDTDFHLLMEKLRKFRDDRDWAQFHVPKNLAISLQLEASEVLELFQWTLDNEIKPGSEGKLGAELADVFYWTLMLADKHGIDLLAALDKKMIENEAKYPIDKAKGRSAKYTEL